MSVGEASCCLHAFVAIPAEERRGDLGQFNLMRGGADRQCAHSASNQARPLLRSIVANQEPLQSQVAIYSGA